MRHFIVATHANMSKGIKSTLDLIIGERDDLSCYCAYVEPGVIYKEELLKEIEKYPKEDEVIITTDIFGGSVNNELTELISRGNVHLITGVNLVLLIGMLVSCEEEDIEEMIRRNVEEAKKGIIYCNDLESLRDSSLDEF
ncbi:MAG: hypothetical protein EOM50_06120 [Erysipelotrichia bacterium]|nr:hypothetical protein [Erysipelotrichia bacterium]NCC54944.1 hypothetical protein [Erysipelotrichia bacterium]